MQSLRLIPGKKMRSTTGHIHTSKDSITVVQPRRLLCLLAVVWYLTSQLLVAYLAGKFAEIATEIYLNSLSLYAKIVAILWPVCFVLNLNLMSKNAKKMMGLLVCFGIPFEAQITPYSLIAPLRNKSSTDPGYLGWLFAYKHKSWLSLQMQVSWYASIAVDRVQAQHNKLLKSKQRKCHLRL